MSNRPIYLDYNATTPIDPVVVDAMLPYFHGEFGNPSSTHAYGKTAHVAMDIARAQVANLIGAAPDEIVFTGGGSEASNHAIKGVCLSRPRGLFAKWFGSGGTHIITSAVEHPATSVPIEFLRKLGASVTVLPVDSTCRVDPDALRKAIRPNTRLVSIMHSNNEVGTLMPIRELAQIARAAGVLFHTDCAQSLGKVPVNVSELGIDLLTIAGHKLYAPKGIGALYIRRGVALEPLIHGAGHETGRRAGTENVPYIVGLGVAAEIAAQLKPEAKLKHLRDRLHSALGDRVALNGHPTERLPNTLNVNFHGQIGAELLAKLPGLAASTGSACHEGQVTQSAVLCAMGVSPSLGRGAVRLTVGRWTTETEIDEAAEMLGHAVR